MRCALEPLWAQRFQGENHQETVYSQQCLTKGGNEMWYLGAEEWCSTERVRSSHALDCQGAYVDLEIQGCSTFTAKTITSNGYYSQQFSPNGGHEIVEQLCRRVVYYSGGFYSGGLLFCSYVCFIRQVLWWADLCHIDVYNL